MRSTFEHIQRISTVADQLAENSGREMFEAITLVTTGEGQLIQTDPVTFKGPFSRRPHVMYGSEIVIPPDPQLFTIPTCSGSVYRFVRDDRGLYIGAYLCARVEMSSYAGSGSDDEVQVRHSFVLLGVSIKELGVASDLPTELDVREVPL